MIGHTTSALVFTIPSIATFASHINGRDIPSTVPADGSWGLFTEEIAGIKYVLDRNVREHEALVVIALGESGFFSRLNMEFVGSTVRRMHRIAVQIGRRQHYFPPAWSQYSSRDLLSVFAYNTTYGRERIIAQIGTSNHPDVFFWGVTTPDEQIDLDTVVPDTGLWELARKNYPEAAATIEARFEGIVPVPDSSVVDLEALGAGAVTGGRTFSGWFPVLSDTQNRFVLQDTDRSVKLRGPAGSGKTLAMELKALRASYAAADSGQEIRILYATHSWAVAEQVQRGLDQLDERGTVGQIDVFPLLTLAQFALEDRGRFNVLGDDSYTGKQAQLRVIAKLMEDARGSDWITFKNSVTEEFAGRVEAKPGTIEANRLLWDIMLEFSGVIGANGILPGINADQRYKQIERRAWMMPLQSDAEKEFVLLLYTRFVKHLRSQNEMSSDQVINDFLNYLSTFRWYSERATKGYDLIFVDEYHLFDEQERAVFHFLSRDPEAYPVVFMALDPRQSPAESYAEFAVPGLTQPESSIAEAALGATQNIDLDRVYRYTPEILELLQCFDRFYPTFDLGQDWEISLAAATSTREGGEVPTLAVHPTAAEEWNAVVADVTQLAAGRNHVALLCVDAASFGEYRELATHADVRFQLIESRDDVEKLQYTRRSVVLSQPEYVAGLQFDAVVIAGVRPATSHYAPNQSYSLRRFLSDLYLGASRARDVLRIHATGTAGEFPQAFEVAVQEGILSELNHT